MTGSKAALLNAWKLGISHSPTVGSESDRIGDKGLAVDIEFSGDNGAAPCARGNFNEERRFILIVAEEAIVAHTPSPFPGVEGLLPEAGASYGCSCVKCAREDDDTVEGT
jgi:hypothetical protein